VPLSNSFVFNLGAHFGVGVRLNAEHETRGCHLIFVCFGEVVADTCTGEVRDVTNPEWVLRVQACRRWEELRKVHKSITALPHLLFLSVHRIFPWIPSACRRSALWLFKTCLFLQLGCVSRASSKVDKAYRRGYTVAVYANGSIFRASDKNIQYA